MPYSWLTRLESENALAARLFDPLKIRWVAAELRGLLAEALYTWQSITGMWEASEEIIILAGTVFVDLPTSYSSLCGYTLKDQDLVLSIQSHTWEKRSATAWTGTAMFTLPDLTAAIQRRRDQFLLETGCRLTRDEEFPDSPDVLGPGPVEVELSDLIMDVQRAVWLPTSNGGAVFLSPSDFWGQRAADLQPGIPQTFSVSERSPHVLRLAPDPDSDGRLDLLTINAGATLNPAAGVLLGVPDNFAWVIRWGALADLLSTDGPARDYARSLFCERRYRAGVAAAAAFQLVRDARVDGRAAEFSTIDALDSPAVRSWQTRRGTVAAVAPVGMNLLALCLPPSSDIRLKLSLSRTAPVPSADGDFMQFGREYFDLFLGYAQHLAMFKIGGTEFAATSHLADAFFDQALAFNPRLKKSAFEFEPVTTEIRKADRTGVERQTGATLR